MAKLIPEAHVQSDHLEWRPWADDRSQPFEAEGAQGQAWVKVLSRDPKTEAETLLYRLDQGWSAERVRNTVYENLLILDGEIEVNGTTLRKYAFSYRPEGHEVGPISTVTGAVVMAIAGAPGEPASRIPVDGLDTESMPWVEEDLSEAALVDSSVVRSRSVTEPRYYLKILRGDEENLDTYYLMRGVRGFESDGVSSHDAPEETFILEGCNLSYDSVTGGRQINTRGTYCHRGARSPHGFITIVEDILAFKHDYYHPEDNADLRYSAYPRETPAVKALKEGRDPGLAPRW
jgi:hypothetical protein